MNVDLSSRVRANLDVVLENACRRLSAIGGDHASRKVVAERLMAAAVAGRTTLGNSNASLKTRYARVAAGDA